MFDKQPDRLGLLAHPPPGLIDDVEMVQRKLVANHPSKVRAVAPDHPVAIPGFAHEGFGEQPATAMGAIKRIAPPVGLARLQGPGPGVITHAVDLFRSVPAPTLGQALWITLIEQRHACAGE